MQDSTGQGALDRLCPAGVQNLLDIFAEAGVGAYPVGGCVRDALMGHTPHDWDIAVTCPPDRTVALCAAAGLRTVPTGIAHGTVTVLVPAPAGGRMPVECTTCRTETGYSDGRHPDSVAGWTTWRDASSGAWAIRSAACGRTPCASCAGCGFRFGWALSRSRIPARR